MRTPWQKWTDEEVAELRRLVAIHQRNPVLAEAGHIAAMLNAKFGTKRTAPAVNQKLQLLGIKRGTIRWTNDMLEVIYSMWGAIPASEIRRRINSKFATRFTTRAVQSKAWTLGLHYSDAQGDLTQKDAATIVGISDSFMSELVRRGEVKVYGKGRARYLMPGEVEKLQARFAAPPEPTVSSKEAARRLCYTAGAIGNLCNAGKLRAWKVRGHWRIPVSQVDAILAKRNEEMEATA